MSVSIVQYPAQHTSTGFEQICPAYNPIVFTVDSTNKAQCSFEYVCDVYINGSYITRLKAFPLGVNGYGTFKVQEVIADYLTYDLQINLYGSSVFAKNPNSFLAFELKFGEEFDSSAQCDSGTIIYPSLTSTSSVVDFKAFNGALQYKEWLTLGTGNYVAVSAASKFLTDFPNEALICYGDQMVFNIIVQNGNADFLRVKTYNESNVLIGTYQLNNSLSIPLMDLISVGVGPENLNNSTLAVGVQPVISSLVKYYTVQLFQTAGPTANSELKTINIDTRVTKWDRHRLWFLNHYGSFDSYTFTLKDKLSTDISRTEYNKVFGELTNLSPGYTWTYDVKDRGRTTLNVNGQDGAVYQSNWLTEAESLWMKELFLTLECYEASVNSVLCFGGITINPDNGNLVIYGDFDLEVGDVIQVDVGNNVQGEYLNDEFEILIVLPGGDVEIGNPFDPAGDPPDLTQVTGQALLVGFVSELDPLIIKNKSYEEKTKNKIKNINHIIEIDKAYGINRQRN